jgi:hypothetical protein
MKNLFLISLLSIMLISFGCKKDDPSSSKASFSAKVQGTMWTGSIVTAVQFTGENLIMITAAGTNPSEQISLDIKASGTGTFPINNDNLGTVEIGTYSFTSLISSNPLGQVVITKYDVTNKKISGTFYFDGEDMAGTVYHVTEGKFENIDLVID